MSDSNLIWEYPQVNMSNVRKIIVAGSRDITDYTVVCEAIEKSGFVDGIHTIEIVSGKARGVDTLGEQYAKDNNLKVHEFPADWDKYGKSAGYRRNSVMAKHADCLVAIWDGKSRGTLHMINIMNDYNKPVYVHHVDFTMYD